MDGSINGQIKGTPKKAAFLMTYADTAAGEAEPMLAHYRTLMDYLGWTSVGEVVASGVWTAGSGSRCEIFPDLWMDNGKLCIFSPPDLACQ